MRKKGGEVCTPVGIFFAPIKLRYDKIIAGKPFFFLFVFPWPKLAVPQTLPLQVSMPGKNPHPWLFCCGDLATTNGICPLRSSRL